MLKSTQMDLKLFPAFFDAPENIFFAEQEPNEKIELFLRQHPIVNLGWIISVILAIMVPLILLQLDLSLQTGLFATIPIKVLVGAIIIWYLLVTAYSLEKFLFWYFNIYIVTNFHIIDIDFTSLLSRDIIEIELKDIESISTHMAGIFGPLFNFGDVKVETAAKKQAVKCSKVPFPDLVSDRIDDLRLKRTEGGE